MWSIKIFKKCVLSYYSHYIFQLSVPETVDDKKRLSYEVIDKNNIDLIGGGYFDTSNMYDILSNKKNKALGYIFKNDHQEIVGYACLTFKGGKEFHYRVKSCDAFLFDFAVMKEFRGNGYGTLILNSIASMLKGKTLSLAVKTNNVPAISVYKKFGFQLIKTKKFIRFFKIDFPYLQV